MLAKGTCRGSRDKCVHATAQPPARDEAGELQLAGATGASATPTGASLSSSFGAHPPSRSHHGDFGMCPCVDRTLRHVQDFPACPF